MSKLELTDISVASASFGTELVTLIAGNGRGPARVCRSCIVKPHKDNTADVLVGCKAQVDGSEFPLPSSELPIPIANTNQLFFSSTQANAKVHIMWRL